MKKLYALIFCGLIPFLIRASDDENPNQTSIKRLNALFSYTVFYSAETGPYVETYLSVDGNSVNFRLNDNGKYQASVEVLVMFSHDEKIISFDKYKLRSPELEDTTNIGFSFLDQQRYPIPPGLYDFEIQINDKNSESPPFVGLQPLEIDFEKEKIAVSGIQLVDSYEVTKEVSVLSKHGYDLIPYISNFFPETVNKLKIYSEVYNTDKVFGKDEGYLVTVFITDMERSGPVTGFISRKRETSAPLNVVFSEFNISNLASGNYFVVIEVRDQKNEVTAMNRIFFQRSNPKLRLKMEDIASVNSENTFASIIQSDDTLRGYIKSLSPISNGQERLFSEYQVQTADLETLQKYFYMFWYERNPLDPEKAWLEYKQEVMKVQNAYSTLTQHGYETDRGRVYLQYGPPNSISSSYEEPAAYPYEIWHYYGLPDGQRNRRFVFYSRGIVTNDFVLLHSDAIGELANYRWNQILHRRVDPGFDLDQGATPDAWGSQSRRYFLLPY